MRETGQCIVRMDCVISDDFALVWHLADAFASGITVVVEPKCATVHARFELLDDCGPPGSKL